MCFVKELTLLQTIQLPFKCKKINKVCDLLSFQGGKRTFGRNVSSRLQRIQVTVANILISSFSEFGFKKVRFKVC